MKLVCFPTLPATIANSGFYDHQVIEYQATAEVTSSPHLAGQGTLEVTSTLVRCPVVDFAAIR